MTFKLEALAIAEGFTTDSRGALTLVGFNPPVFTVESFPETISPVVVAMIRTGRGNSNGISLELRYRITGTNGEDLFFNAAKQTPDPSPFPDTEYVQAIAQLPFIADKSGIYTVEVDLATNDGERTSAKRKLRIYDNAYLMEFAGKARDKA